MRYIYHTDINLWHYGRVTPHAYTPVFVLRTRRTDKSRVFINICVCDAVPTNPKGIITCNTDRLVLGRGGAVDFVQHDVSYEDVCRELEQTSGATSSLKTATAVTNTINANTIDANNTSAGIANSITTTASGPDAATTANSDNTIIDKTSDVSSVNGSEHTDRNSVNSELEDAPAE